ncbi:MAG: type III pantothenate kinase, partial [Thermodesulfobacteriota bacterium]
EEDDKKCIILTAYSLKLIAGQRIFRVMKLLIDIGNTNTSIAIIKAAKIRKRYFIHTSRKQVEPATLKRLLGADLRKIKKIVVANVVPKFFSVIKKSLKTIAPGIPVLVIGRDIKVPMKNKYRKPEEVGQDRLVVSYAASLLRGTPVLVVDFGTAVTFDFVNKKGEYEGGLIFPGLRLGFGALVNNAALLPEIEIGLTSGLIGRDTRGSMNKGIIYGYAAMCDGIIRLFRKKYGRSLKVVATGGDAELVARYTRYIKTIYPDLIFTGLDLLAG